MPSALILAFAFTALFVINVVRLLAVRQALRRAFGEGRVHVSRERLEMIASMLFTALFFFVLVMRNKDGDPLLRIAGMGAWALGALWTTGLLPHKKRVGRSGTDSGKH